MIVGNAASDTVQETLARHALYAENPYGLGGFTRFLLSQERRILLSCTVSETTQNLLQVAGLKSHFRGTACKTQPYILNFQFSIFNLTSTGVSLLNRWQPNKHADSLFKGISIN